MSTELPPTPPIDVPLAAPPSSNDERMWATFVHMASLLALLGLPIGNILGPLIIWLIKRNDSKFVDAHGKESLNFQISVTIYLLGCLAVALISCGFLAVVSIPVAIIIGIAAIVLAIIAAIKANNGEMYEYPLTIRLIK